MSYAGQRLNYLLRDYAIEELVGMTGLGEEEIYESINGLYTVQGNNLKNVISWYRRSIYADARAAGATRVQATRLRNLSVDNAVEYIQSGVRYINDLVDYIFERRKASAIKKGTYTSDDDLRRKLYDSIATNAGKSRKNTSEDFWKNSPSLHHIFEPNTDDEE